MLSAAALLGLLAPTNPPARTAAVFTDTVGARQLTDLTRPYAVAGITITGATGILWTVVSAPAGATATLTGETTASPSVTVDRPGVYVLQCAVTGLTGTANHLVMLSTAREFLIARSDFTGPLTLSADGTYPLLIGPGGVPVDVTVSGTANVTSAELLNGLIVVNGPDTSGVSLSFTLDTAFPWYTGSQRLRVAVSLAAITFSADNHGVGFSLRVPSGTDRLGAEHVRAGGVPATRLAKVTGGVTTLQAVTTQVAPFTLSLDQWRDAAALQDSAGAALGQEAVVRLAAGASPWVATNRAVVGVSAATSTTSAWDFYQIGE